jgi:hypothetical protein
MDEKWRLRAEAGIRKDSSDLHREILENVISAKALTNFLFPSRSSFFLTLTRLDGYEIFIMPNDILDILSESSLASRTLKSRKPILSLLNRHRHSSNILYCI